MSGVSFEYLRHSARNAKNLCLKCHKKAFQARVFLRTLAGFSLMSSFHNICPLFYAGGGFGSLRKSIEILLLNFFAGIFGDDKELYDKGGLPRRLQRS